MQTFRFQAVCQNHIVWDAIEVVEFSRKHTANVHESLAEIRRRVEALVEKPDVRRDGFVEVIRKAMAAKLLVDRRICEGLRQTAKHSGHESQYFKGLPERFGLRLAGRHSIFLNSGTFSCIPCMQAHSRCRV